MVDNYLSDGGVHLAKLEHIGANYPLVFHSVGFNLGSVDPFDRTRARQVRRLCEQFAPAWVSDHLAWTGAHGRLLHDLLPLPRNWGVVRHVAERVRILRDILELPILLENISRYFDPQDCEMSEWEFLSEVVEAADAGILLDVNNAVTNARNGCPEESDGFLTLPKHRVKQIHLAGAERINGAWIDTHGAAVDEDVWAAVTQAIKRFGPIPICIERDNNVPPLPTLLSECKRAASLLKIEWCDQIAP